jgi:fermentation-respiration switch protein FrsA (DUF1100 family)
MDDRHSKSRDAAGLKLGRRDLGKLAGAGVAALGLSSVATRPASAQPSQDWDKVFPRSARVDHQKVTFRNRLGITLVADLYMPKGLDRSRRHPALVVGHPFGGVKEQTSGLYAQTMAERGFVTVAHDASYQGESGGQPHFVASPEAFVEDFSAAVDHLGSLSFVDRKRIGVIGICGSGGWALGAAKIDPRMRAVATVSMYDIGQANRQGLARVADPTAEKQAIEAAAEQRWADYAADRPAVASGVVDVLTAETDPVSREFHDYYREPRSQHPRATNEITVTSRGALFRFDASNGLETLSPRPVLFVMGETAHSRVFSEMAHERAAEPKELFVVPGAGHVDLYDRVDLIPWDKLQSFFDQHLTA